MFKLKKRDITYLLYCAIAVFIIFFIYKMFYYAYDSNSNNIEAFSIRKSYNSQKRKLKNFNNKHVKKYTSKISKFFKSIF
jgi:hypothetical protein